MDIFTVNDFSTPQGQEKIIKFLNFLDQKTRGYDEQLTDLVTACQPELIAMGKAYAKPENLGVAKEDYR